AGVTCTWTGVVGFNFGFNAIGSDLTQNSCSCNGRCGAGCSGAAVGKIYTQDCFNFTATPTAETRLMRPVDDTVLGAIRGCGQTNLHWLPRSLQPGRVVRNEDNLGVLKIPVLGWSKVRPGYR
ncbi:hypothetical protein B0T18DRAFT_316138, partial [Schizothecium vesticola]